MDGWRMTSETLTQNVFRLAEVKDQISLKISQAKVSVDSHKDHESIEQYDINSNITDHPELEQMCLSQMVKMYEPNWGKEKKKLMTPI